MTKAEAMKAFNVNRFLFGVVGPEDTVHFEFTYDGEIPLWGVDRDCGCTDAYIDGNTVKGHLDMKSAATYKNKYTEVEKNLTIWFDDGEGFFKRDEQGRMSKNTNKLKINLQIAGQVDLDIAPLVTFEDVK